MQSLENSYADGHTILFGKNNVISQVKNDKNLCKISTFVILLENGTEVAELPFGGDHSQLIEDLLKSNNKLKFAFKDVRGETTVTKDVADKPGICVVKKCFFLIYYIHLNPIQVLLV
jgi:hypothetical protein